MTTDTTFQYSIQSESEEFDPFAELASEKDGAEDVDEFPAAVAADAVPAEVAETSVVDELTPFEKTCKLLESMGSQRNVLLAVLNLCECQQPVVVVNDFIDEQQADNVSVFSPANLCALLEQSGALERVDVSGQLITEEDAEPQVVVVDGVEYLEPVEPVEVFWHTTPAGVEAYETDRPEERLRALLDDGVKYAVIYKRILTMCQAKDGATAAAINDAVDNDPLVQDPRLYGPYFTKRLEQCGAIVWHKHWEITEVGKEGLALLADVIDAYSPDETNALEAGITTPEGEDQ